MTAQSEFSRPYPGALSVAIDRARDELLSCQHDDGHWSFELEADCTIPAEYILMMHFMDEIDARLQQKLAVYIRDHQTEEGGWPLYFGGEIDQSCSVKAYYALKLAGDSPAAPHMVCARKAILGRGGAAAVNVFTRIALATFQQIPWRAVPFVPVEVILLPRWFLFHLSKVSYWSRTVMVPLTILVSRRATAVNPTGLGIEELFEMGPFETKYSYPAQSLRSRAFVALDQIGRRLEFLIPEKLRQRATRSAEQWILERLNGEDGLGAIFPAMVNAYEALAELGYPPDHPLRTTALSAIQNLLVESDDSAYCQPCVSPVWDTGLACHALLEAGEDADSVDQALEWLRERQITVGGDWQDQRPDAPPGGWAFQYRNDHYPDLDDTAVVAWAMHRSDPEKYAAAINLATDWTRDLQSVNGGFAAFDADNTAEHLNEIPFADHKALLDPPTADVSARVATLLAQCQRPQDQASLNDTLAYLDREQEDDGAWFGRWGTNYIYGTWSALVALQEAGRADSSAAKRGAEWLKRVQRDDGGWGESNDSYEASTPSSELDNQGGNSFQTAWALLGLMAAGEVDSPAVERGINYLVAASDRSRRLVGHALHRPRLSSRLLPQVSRLQPVFPTLGTRALPPIEDQWSRAISERGLMPRLGVLCAMQSETNAFQRGAGSADYLAVTCGIGPTHATEGALKLVRDGAEVIISFGFAGALAPHLAAGRLDCDISGVDRGSGDRVQSARLARFQLACCWNEVGLDNRSHRDTNRQSSPARLHKRRRRRHGVSRRGRVLSATRHRLPGNPSDPGQRRRGGALRCERNHRRTWQAARGEAGIEPFAPAIAVANFVAAARCRAHRQPNADRCSTVSTGINYPRRRSLQGRLQWRAACGARSP